MARLPKPITKLIESFEKLPGIGPKSAARLTFYLLHVPQSQLDDFSSALADLKRNTVECAQCFNIAETNPCSICADIARDRSLICVVEQPIDIISIERMGQYHGVYHVLHGSLNPLENIGPDELRITQLMQRITQAPDTVKEIIIATNINTEGEATAMYIQRIIRTLQKDSSDGIKELKVSRLAHGLPLGADVQYADEFTLKEAFSGRRNY